MENLEINTIGQKYDQIAQSFRQIRKQFQTEKKYLDIFMGYLPKNGLILDLGCGCGTPIDSYLVKNGFDVVGMDDSEAMLVLAANDVPEMRVLWADMKEAYFEPEFDGIIEWFSLFHLEVCEQKKLLQNSIHWLEKGGVLQFTTGSYAYEDKENDMFGIELPFFSATKEEYAQWIEEVGYKIILCENDQEDHLVWIAQK